MVALTLQNHQDCLFHFRNLIRINTTNPPGNEIEAVLYLKNIFDEAQIPYQIFEPKPGRASIVARLSGQKCQAPFLMSSHLDVVPSEPKEWRFDPFSAVVEDDCVWGRGAVDMKNMTAMTLVAFLKLNEHKDQLKNDVIFAAVADEEAGSHWGSAWIAKHHPESLKAAYGINEVGGFSLSLLGKTFYPIGVAEKGAAWVTLTHKGEAGHASLPNATSALTQMAQTALHLAQLKMPFQKSEVVLDFIKGVSDALPWPKALFFKALAYKVLNRRCVSLIPNQKIKNQMKALFSNTLVPTQISASDKINVLPSQATLGIDGRIVPGSSVEDWLDTLKKNIPSSMEIKIKFAQNPSVIPDYKNDFYNLLCRSLKKFDPAAHPIPFLIPGFSDSHHYHKLGIKCYGFAPAKLDTSLNLGDLYHAKNERLPLAALEFGLNALWEVAAGHCMISSDKRSS